MMMMMTMIMMMMMLSRGPVLGLARPPRVPVLLAALHPLAHLHAGVRRVRLHAQHQQEHRAFAIMSTTTLVLIKTSNFEL